MPVIPAKAGIHFDFSPGGATTTLLLRGVRMRNPENSPFVFVFDSDPFRPGAETSERGDEKAKAKMDSGQSLPPRSGLIAGMTVGGFAVFVGAAPRGRPCQGTKATPPTPP